jgi:cytoskeleton protein RodZ
MAAQIGETLRKARTRQGIELSEVERATKIRVKFLRAMEEDRWEALPAPAYARGFLSTYAGYLGLDEESLLDAYRRAAPGSDRVEPIPPSVLRSGSLTRRHSLRRPAIVLTGVTGLVVLAVVLATSIGGSEGGDAEHREEASAVPATGTTERETEGATASGAGTTEGSLGIGTEVSLELRSTGTVWVCVVDDEGLAPVNGETLTADEVRGPFASRSFEMTFGNGSVEITADGDRSRCRPWPSRSAIESPRTAPAGSIPPTSPPAR